ncbi:hypothetical protein C8Q70DRAFT_1006442 [Cubamyces menziesii]|nr:hypothetical protein C8Q70DRAFT_1006442 [Cubamyces menziesii]
MSFLFRLFRRLRTPRGYVGSDLEGNQFFEYPGVTNDSRRTKRVVKYAEGRDMWAYVGGSKRLPVQWTAWLTHTRPHPPTLEELQADLERQRRVLFNAAMIEAREREEVARVAAAQQQTVRIQAPAAEGVRVSAEPKRPAEMSPSETARVDTAADRREPATEQPSPWKPPPSDEPHSWQPRAAVRRGS